MARGDDGAKGGRDAEGAAEQAAAIAKIRRVGRATRGGDAGEFAGKHGVEDAGAGEGVDEAKRVAGAVVKLVGRLAEPFGKDEGAGDEPIHGASEWAQALGERGAAPDEIAGVKAEGSEDSLRSETANVGGAVFDGADPDVAVLEEVEFHVVVDRAAEVGLEPEKTIAGWSDGPAPGGEDNCNSLGGGGPVLANHLRAFACGAIEEETVEFVATEAVGEFGQRMADDTHAEVESHRTQDGGAELKETRLAAGAAEQWEDGRRKEFAADLVPREGGLFEDPYPSALTHGGKCGHHAGWTSAHNMDRPHRRSS